MEKIPLPKVEYKPGARPSLGELVIEPLFPGYGTTIGNALRRILLSSLPGAAVTAVKFYNTPHEFTTIPKVQEDVLEIILNLKKLRLKIHADEPVKLHLKAKGEKVVTAGDIDKDSSVEIANPDLVIATLTGRDAELEMDITVTKGRGFMPTEAREKQKGEIGTIAVDALFSPIRRVSFRVDGARVGQMTNFDKLTMEIESDGTISPDDAVMASTNILTDHFALLQNLGSSSSVVAAESDEEAEDVAEDASDEAGDDEAPKKKRATKKKKDEE